VTVLADDVASWRQCSLTADMLLIDPPSSLKNGMAHLALSGLCPVLDLGHQLWLDPDAAMRDARWAMRLL
jgi:hypothetical protein